MSDSRMVILFGGNEYEILDKNLKAEVACLIMPAAVLSSMGKSEQILLRTQTKGGE